MEQEVVPVSKFKATCLALLDKVKRTGQPVLVTKRGKPIALITPPPRTQKTGQLARGLSGDRSDRRRHCYSRFGRGSMGGPGEMRRLLVGAKAISSTVRVTAPNDSCTWPFRMKGRNASSMWQNRL